MTPGRDLRIRQCLAPLSAATGSGAVSLPFSSLPDVLPILLAIISATSVCIMTLLRWLPPHLDMFERGYLVGWADATQEHIPYPGNNVRSLRPVKS
jgi:hypothetical protein